MANTKKTSSVKNLSRLVDQTSKKVWIYYLIYCLIFLFLHMTLASLVTFFNFLMDHDMGTIENWLSRNGWDLLTISKVVGVFIMVKSTRLNNYNQIRLRDLVRDSIKLPQVRGLILVLFLMAFTYISHITFGVMSDKIVDFRTEEVLTSYFGSIIFYGCDFLFLYYLFFGVAKDLVGVKKIFALFVVSVFFWASTNLALPYTSPNQLYLISYFVGMLIIGLRQELILGNTILYLIGYVGFNTIIYGQDLLWGQNYKLIQYTGAAPVAADFLIWLVGILFFHYRLSRLSNGPHLTKL